MKKREEKQNKSSENKKEFSLITKESLCAVGALFSALAFFILCTNELIFGATIGGTIFDFLIGVFGLCAYPLFLGTFYACGMGLIGKRLIKNRKAMTFVVLAAICLAMVIHTAATYSWEMEGYIVKCFQAPALEEGAKVTVVGWLGSLLVYVLAVATTKVGAIIVLSVCMLFLGYLAYVTWKNGDHIQKVKKEKTAGTTNAYGAPVEIPLMQTSQANTQPTQAPQQPLAQPIEQPVATPAPVFTQPTQGTQSTETAYGMGNVSVTQTPAFSIPDDKQDNVGTSNSFSPFGKTESMQNEVDDSAYQNSREYLFNYSPAENYKKNLIFDPNANVNKRVLQDGTTPTPSGGTYLDSYQDAINGQAARPTKVFTDRSQPVQNYPPVEESIPPRQSEPVSPLYTLETPKEEPASPVYPTRETPSEDFFVERTDREESVAREESVLREDVSLDTDYKRHSNMDLFSPANPNVFGNSERDRAFARETFGDRESFDRNVEDIAPVLETMDSDRDGLHLFDEEDDNPYELRSGFESSRDLESARGMDRDILNTPDRVEDNDRFSTDSLEDRGSDRFSEVATPSVTPVVSVPTPEPTPPPPPKPRVIRPYVRPNLDDFDCRDVEPVLNPEEVEETKENILATLEDFKVSGATIASTTFGPTVTRYNITIPRNIPPQKVVALDQPIAISLRSSGVNIYPNYEDGVVSIEVPNKDRQFVQLGCMLSGDTFVNAKSSSIMFTMGKDAGNRKVYGDISKMIHMLVAGSSGSGKSVFLGSLIISLIYKYSPEELRLILIDPKKTEFVLYNNLPHLMINEIITEAPKAVQSLNWAIGEMNRRYGLFEKMSRAGTYVVNLDQYNSHVEKVERLPKIVIIIDELADLMLAAKKDIEDKIQNLTQKARAAGIHLVVATQRPSTDVITGVIKSNLPTRIAFAVATDVDSRVILDQSGAQKLLGKGDFLYTMQGINTPVRVQSAFISPEDSQRVVNFIKSNNEAYYDETATAYINNVRSGGNGGGGADSEEVEPVYIEALRCAILSNSASISLIQRKCSTGYNKAGKIVEWMEEMGYISSFEGAKARKVLITKEEFESKYGPL